MENKFAPLPLELPLYSDVKTALPKIAEVCKKRIKNNYGEIYAMYIMLLVMAYFIPEYILFHILNSSTFPFTMASRTCQDLRNLL